MKTFHLRPDARISTCTTFIQHNLGSLGHRNQRKKRKGIQIRKEEVKLTLFPGDMILYPENIKDATKKLLNHINEFGKFVE